MLNQLGRISESVVAKEKAVKLAPNDAEAHSNLGVTLQELGRLHEAEASCRQAIALKPDYAEAHYNLGNALQELGRLDEAEASYNQTIALKPDYAEAYSNLGNMLKELGRLDEAESSYNQAIALKLDFAGAHYNLGITLQELGRLDEAEASYNQAIALKPDHAEAHNNLGNVLRPLGRLDEAEASYKQAIVLNPDYAEAHFNLGIALQMQGRFKESEETCRQILDKKSIVVSAERKAPITALLSHGRSGTMFFHSLLDGHPDLATLPGVYFKGWFALNSWQRFAPYLTKPDWQENIVRALVEEYKPLFNSNSQKDVFGEPLISSWLARDTGFTAMGPEGTQFFVVDEDSFSRTLISLLRPLQSITCNYFFELIHRAFEIAIRGRSNLRNESVGHIFYHIHNPNILEKTNFLQHYPEARLLFLTRNPIQSLESLIILGMASARDTNKMFLFWSELVDKIVNMFIIMRTGDSDDRLHRGIKLEDIKHNPTSVMPQIAAWMGIPDHPSLYDSSFCGMQYWGPAGAGVSITGFDKKAINHSIGRFFGERDIDIFETLLWPFLSLYGYTNMDVTAFHTKLSTIRIWLKDPLEFEIKLYEALPEGKSQLQDIGSYKRLHHFLNQMWSTLDKEGTYKAMFQPLKLD